MLELWFQDEWLNCQRAWLYLESIFSAPDIQRQLPAEAKMFMQVDKSYKDIMRKVNKVPAAIRAGTQPGKSYTHFYNVKFCNHIWYIWTIWC
jgi:hypothetical protein